MRVVHLLFAIRVGLSRDLGFHLHPRCYVAGMSNVWVGNEFGWWLERGSGLGKTKGFGLPSIERRPIVAIARFAFEREGICE